MANCTMVPRVFCSLFLVMALAAGARAADPAAKHFALSSPAFGDDAVLPLKYAGGPA